MVDFICIGLTRPVSSANRYLQNDFFLPILKFEPGTFRLPGELAKCCAPSSDIYRALKR